MSNAPVDVAIVLKAVDQTRQGLEQARQNITRFESQVEKTSRVTRGHFAKSAVDIANVTSSALNLYNAYDWLAAVQARLMSLAASLKSARAGYMRVQERLNKLKAQGKENTEAYARELERLEAYEIRIRQYTLQLQDAQDEINKTYLQMALSSVPLATTALQNLSLTNIQAVIPSFKAAAVAAKGFMLSLGPIGWTLIGLTAAVSAFAVAYQTNFMGLKDATDSFVSSVNDGLTNLAVQLGFFKENYGKTCEDVVKTDEKYIESIKTVKTEDSAMISETRRVSEDLRSEIAKTSRVIDEANEKLREYRRMREAEAAKYVTIPVREVPGRLAAAEEMVRRLREAFTGVAGRAEIAPTEITINIENVSSEIDLIRLAELLAEEYSKKKGGM